MSSTCSTLQTAYEEAQRNLGSSNCGAVQPGASNATGNAECAAKLQTVNQRRSDFNVSQMEYDTTCDPVGAYDRRLQNASDAFSTYKSSTERAVESLESVFTARLAVTDKLAVAYGELEKTLTGLTAQYDTMDKKNRDLDQAERTQRRLFLDDDPQAGVGVTGVRTRDDRILLAFWVNYAAALLATALFFCWWRGFNRMTTALTTMVIVGSGYLVAYPLIAYYA